MGTIVAIGGGEINKHETFAIDQEIIKLSCKKRPRVLFIPTASSDSQEYINDFIDYYGNYLDCKVDVLLLIKQSVTTKKISEKFLNSDIVYVGGGNTLMMMNVWRKLGVDKILKKAYQKNIILCGISAGAICWFNFGVSDSRRFKNLEAQLIKVRGLGFISGLLCPHYHSEKYAKDRVVSTKNIAKRTSGVALGIDDFCAIIFIDGQFKIITSKSSANVYKIFWKRDIFSCEKIKQNSDLNPESRLLKR